MPLIARSTHPTGLWLLLLLLACFDSPAHETPISAPDSDAESKIRYYSKRLGGPATYPAYARLGLAYAQKARETRQAKYYRQAREYLEKSLSYQRNFEALLGLATVFSEQHQFSVALPYAEEAAASMSAQPEALGVLFDIRLALGEVEQAQLVLQKIPTGFQSFARLAALREYRGDSKGAFEAILQAKEAAAALNSAIRAWVEVRGGSLLVAQCQLDEARQAYERALHFLPEYNFALEHLAEWHAFQEQWNAAESIYHKLLKKHVEPGHRLALADVLRAQGHGKEAARQEKQAVTELRRAEKAGATDVFRHLAMVLVESDKSAQEGLRYALADWELRQDAFAADTLAWAHFRNNHLNEALKFSKLALRSGTKVPAILLHGSEIQMRNGNFQESQALLERALACPTSLTPRDRILSDRLRQRMSR